MRFSFHMGAICAGLLIAGASEHNATLAALLWTIAGLIYLCLWLYRPLPAPWTAATIAERQAALRQENKRAALAQSRAEIAAWDAA